MNETLYNTLNFIVGSQNVLINEPMSKHTTFRVGGNAAYYVTPEESYQIANIICVCNDHQVPYYIIGNGSNLLVNDNGYDGVIIEIGNKLSKIAVSGDVIIVQSGAKLSRVAMEAQKNGLTGMEFAHGIPGSIGGAVTMNAGAYGGEMKNILLWANVMDKAGNMRNLTVEELDLGYRHSIISQNGMIVLEAAVKLTPGDPEEIKDMMDILAMKRRTKQPLEFPSAGSTFKRPEGYFAGKLIEDAGLKGYTVGGAQVSEKHSGFVINKGNATAQDILTLIDDVKKIVKEKCNVVLEAEVKIL